MFRLAAIFSDWELWDLIFILFVCSSCKDESYKIDCWLCQLLFFKYDYMRSQYHVYLQYARSERSERSAQLLAFKRENFEYSRTKNSHFSMCLFRGCGFTYGKNNITSPCIRFEPLWHCGDNQSKYSGDNLIGLFFFDDLLLLKTTLVITTFQALSKGIFSCLLYTSPSPRDRGWSRMPSSAWKKKHHFSMYPFLVALRLWR